ncbi:MAG: hypothetical protein WC682_05055 [Parcubacteria group bacterium]|jgi:hypothetical protein
MNKKSGCFNKNIISKNIFEREIELCKQLNKESKSTGCNWGKCANCGVIPLLIKLHKGILLEDKKELKEIKKEIFNK